MANETTDAMKDQLRGAIAGVTGTAPIFLCPAGGHWISRPWESAQDEHEFRLICPDCKAEYICPRDAKT
jgi:hypothetical protein